MVKKAIFLLEANDEDVTEKLKKNILSISFTDNAGTQSDSIALKIDGKNFQRPNKDDKLKLYFGYENESLFFAGTFNIQTSTRINNYLLNVTATGVDFSLELKQKKSATFENTTLKNICSTIASAHNLELKSDFGDCIIKNQLQTNESDLNFLTRLADTYNALFSIKNNTLIFIKKNDNNSINEDLPIFEVDAFEVENLSIKYSNKLFYKSCEAKWHDNKENKAKTVVVGDDKPVFSLTGTFKDEADATIKAQAKLSLINKGIVSGSFTMSGAEIYAGANLQLINTINNEDDGIFSIKTVKHNFTPTGGWIVNVEFER
jgi:phage protein D